jgi:hypothetical protein
LMNLSYLNTNREKERGPKSPSLSIQFLDQPIAGA